MSNISPDISPSSNISSPTISRANTPRMYKKRPLEYTDDKTLKRRKNLFPTNQYKTQIPNAIVIPADKMPSVSQAAINQLEFNAAFSSQNNNTSKIASIFPFPVFVHGPGKHAAIIQSSNIPTALTQSLPQTNSMPIKDNTHIHLPKHIHPLVLVCVGNLVETPTQLLEKNITKSFILKDICNNIIPSVNRSWRVYLSPESLALFIVNYLTSVSNGGMIMKELFETMLVYAKMGEQEWMQIYYQVNNSIWKTQVSHLARLAAYQSNSNVMIMQSAISLVNGINNALYSLSELKKFPDFIVVLYNNSIQSNKPLEFCIIVLNNYISKTIQEQESQLSRGQTNLLTFIKSSEEDKLRKILHKRNSLLRDRALPPFKATSFSTYCTAATLERVLPQTSNIVEYQPRGPFKQQEIAALMLLKKVKGLRNSITDTSFISNFTSVEFYIFVPTTACLYWQTVERLSESNLINDAIRTQTDGERIPSIDLAEARVIKFDLSQVVNPQLAALINIVQTRTNTLFVCVQDNAHRFTTIDSGTIPAQNNPVVVSSPCLAYLKLLHMPNVLSIAVTSSPLSLLSSQSNIPIENEVNWNVSAEINPCLLTYPQGAQYKDIEAILEDNTDVKLFEDTVFEDRVEQMCSHSKYESSSFDVIRARLLVQEYTTALLKLTGQAKNLSCTGETFSMLHDIVVQPMNNNYGYGPMIVMRVHNVDIGKFVYDQLVSARKDVGLQYRFEIILDDGSQDLNIDPYFVQRMRTWKFGKHTNDTFQSSYHSARTLNQTTWQPRTYLQLNNLPSILIVSGYERGGETLPKSVSHYDLRLVSGISITSHSLNLDLGYINHYIDSQKANKKDFARPYTKQCVLSSGILPKAGNIFLQNTHLEDSTTNEDFTMSTEEIRENYDISTEESNHLNSTSPVKSPLSQVSNLSSASHSSHKKFSIEHLTANTESVAIQQMETDEIMHSQDGPSSGRNSVISSFSDPEINSNPQENLSIEQVKDITTVSWKTTPGQSMEYTSLGISKPQISNNMPHTIKYKPTSIQPGSLCKTHPTSSLNNITLSREDPMSEPDDDEYDDDDEEDAIGIPDYYNSLTCLLSRPYKNVLTSKFATLNIRDILPPTRDLAFDENQERQPQNNTKDHEKLSKYYRQWANPCSKHIDLIHTSIKSQMQWGTTGPIATRFLLTGPPQVGKTGAYILFIKLLQDLVHSSNFVKIYDKFECENSNYNSRSPTSNISNFSLPKSIDMLKSKFDSNPINLYQHERLSQITNLDCTNSESPIHTSVSFTQQAQDSEANFLTKPSTVYIKQEIQSPNAENENNIFTHNSTFKHENSPPITQDCFSVIQQLPDLAYAYDKSHTCSNCVAYYGRTNNPVYELAYTMNNGQGPRIKFFIPQQHITSFHYTQNKTLIRMNLDYHDREKPMNHDNFICRTPIFTPSTGRASTGLFNLAHVMKHQKYIHIIVVNENEVSEYRKQWPTHIIMALPDMPEYYSLGGVMEFIKEFSTENLHSNEREVANHKHIFWPYILVLSDSCLMFKSTPAQIEPPNINQNNCITLFDVLKFIELDSEFTKYGAMSVRQWTSKSVPEENFTKSFLNTSFLYLHVAMLRDIHFDPLSHTCIAADLTLKLLAFGIPFCRINNFSYIKKFIKSGGESFHHTAFKRTKLNLFSNPQKFIGTPDCDQPSAIALSGSYIMEGYLQMAANKIFPLANTKEHPVLQVNKFMNFSDNTFVSFVHERAHDNQEHHKYTKYGGLLMFSSEMLEDSKFLKKFKFAQGATICLVTMNRLNLRREITRLNLEDSWRFKLSNESFTLCAPQNQPLYFYTGRYDVLQETN